MTPVAQTARMNDIRERAKELTRRLNTAREFAESARQAFTSLDGPPDLASAEFQRVERASGDLARIEGDLALVRSEEAYVLSQMAGVSGDSLTGRDSFLRDPNVMRELAQLASSRQPLGSMNLGPAISRDELLADLGRGRHLAAAPGTADYTGEGARTAPYYGLVPQLRRALTLLDLIPTAGMEGKVLPYVSESGPLDSAVETSELAVKAATEQDLTDAEALARTIASYLKVARQVLADVSGLQTAISSRLVYSVMRRLEGQILAGDGTGENILGILNTTGIASVAYNAAELAADQALDGIVSVLLSNAQPNAVVLNPVDWAKMLKAKSTGSGEYLSQGAFVTTAQQLWGVSVVKNPLIPAGTALIGDFTIGATVFIREGVNIRVSDADQDDFVRNRISVLGEGRFALAVWQPAAFAEVHLA